MELLLILSTLILISPLVVNAASEHDDNFTSLVIDAKPRAEELLKVLAPVPQDVLERVFSQMATFYIPLDAEGELCRTHSAVLLDSFLNRDLWAIQMVDSSSKLPSGVMSGNWIDLGSYDQCLSVEVPGELFRGQHCFVKTEGLFPQLNRFSSGWESLDMIRTDVAFSLCVPSSCSALDVQTHLNAALAAVNASAHLSDYSCTSPLAEPFSLMDWVAIFLLVLISALVVVSSVYDTVYPKSETSPLVTCFSLKTNVPYMLDTHCSATSISCLNGLRVLATGWIIFGHRALYILAFPNVSFQWTTVVIKEILAIPFQNGQIPVEIFFLLSGSLMTYSYLRIRLCSTSISLWKLYLLRYIRITPSFALTVLLYATLLIRLGDGPLWKYFFGPKQEECSRYWWSSLLYINTYVSPHNVCPVQAWYLSVDFQLHLVLSLLLPVLHRSPRLGLSLVATLLIMTTAGALHNAHYYQLRAGGVITYDRRTELNLATDYTKTHLRAASFLIGIALGSLLFNIKMQQTVIKLSKFCLWMGWSVSMFLILFSVFFVTYFDAPDNVYSPMVDNLYLVLHRHMFSLGLAWIILVCTLGYGGFVDRFLSWRWFIPLARLSYSVFLTHLFLQQLQSRTHRTNNFFTNLDLINHFFGDCVLGYLSGALLFLTLEAPVVQLTNHYLQGIKKSEDDVADTEQRKKTM